MMKSILDDLRPEARPKLWQKCERLSRKTDDKQFTMFATLSDCRMEHASEFYRMSSTCGALQQNLSQGCWAVIKSNTAFLSALSSRNGPKMTPTLSPTSLLVTNLGYLGTTLRLSSSHLSGRFKLHHDQRKHDKFGAMWNQCWFFFWILKASCIRNLFHQDRWWMENYIATFWSDWGKTSGTNVQTSGTTTPGSCIIKMLWLKRHSLCSSFWLLQIWQSSPTLPTHWTLSPVTFSYSWRWNWSSRGDVLTALKRSRP